MADCGFEGAVGKAIVHDGFGGAPQAFYESNAEVATVNGQPRPPESKLLLFAHVTNAPGFDTRIAITNTTEDGLGTEPLAGACRIDYFGQGAPAPQTSSVIEGGDTLVLTLSQGNPAAGIAGAPGFVGYVTATCDFPLARGFAMVTEYLEPADPPQSSPRVAGFGLDAELLDAGAAPELTLEGASQTAPATALLLPHASARGGYETWLAIANTSLDALGTAPQGGTCVVSYHGDGGGPAIAPQSIALPAGETAAFPLSQGSAAYAVAGAPDFRGSLSIACDFERARAVALIASGSGAKTKASFSEQAELLSLPRDAAPAPVTQPFATHEAGQDRVVVLTNTSLDAFGSAPADGACTLTYRGTLLGGGPTPGPASIPLPAGMARSFLLSRGLPALGVPSAAGFGGYLYSNCDAGMVRGVDYRLEPTPGWKPFCEIDAKNGVGPEDIAALTALVGEGASVGDPADPDGDGVVTDADVAYCGTLVAVEPPGADLSLDVGATPSVARPQRSLRFRLRVTNKGPEAAEGALAVVTLPPAFMLQRSPSGCTVNAVTWTCNLGTLPPGAGIVLTFVGNPSAGSDALTASAQVSSATLDPDVANNVRVFSVPRNTQVDIATGANMIPASPAPGDAAALTLRVSNYGPASAAGVQLQAQLPAQIQLLQTPPGCALSAQVLSCNVGTLAAGATKTYPLSVQLAVASGPMLTTVNGSTSGSDYRPENNSYVLETTVGAP